MPPAPPVQLSVAARRVWRDIVASRAPGYFDAGSLPPLESYCVAVVASRAAMAWLDAAPPGTREGKAACAAVVKLTMMMCSVGTKLRILPSSKWRADGGRLDEPGTGLAGGGGLLGGDAAFPRKRPN